MKMQMTIPKMPELGHSEAYYCRLAHDCEKMHDELGHEAAKVGQYVTLAMGSTLVWEEKQRYLRHALNRHCVPPRIADDEVWAFYKDLQNIIRDVAGEEAMRIASCEDDLYAALLAMGHPRAEIEERAEVFFKRMLPTDVCPDWFHDEDFAQLKLIRDQWI